MKRNFLPVLVLVGVLLAACTSPAPAVETPAATLPTEVPSAPTTPTAPALPESTATQATPEPFPVTTEVIRIPAADGLELVGTFTVPQTAVPLPGVLLLHMLGSQRSAWDELTPQLTAHGMAVLALDLRGFGDTGGTQDWTKAPDDVLRAWKALAARPEVDPARTAIVGASIGANLALLTGAAEPSIRAVALLSPGLNYHGLQTKAAMGAYGSRPVMLVASQEDSYSADSVQTLKDLAQGEAQVVLFDGAGHGTDMFGPQPGLAATLIDWLQQNH